jgi:hypothetical protein
MDAQANCFELLGFDVMVDRQLKPWLIEVNSSPSLACETPLDMHVKGALVRDLLQLDDPLDFDRRALLQVSEATHHSDHGWAMCTGVDGLCCDQLYHGDREV